VSPNGHTSVRTSGPLTRQSSHAADVLAMRAMAWGLPEAVGVVPGPGELSGPHAASVQSALQVFGFDCQVRPVIVAQGELTLPWYAADWTPIRFRRQPGKMSPTAAEIAQ
jgi:hypothetical protein